MLPTENDEANRRTASESRMREIRASGSMRGMRVWWFTTRASLLYLKQRRRGWILFLRRAAATEPVPR